MPCHCCASHCLQRPCAALGLPGSPSATLISSQSISKHSRALQSLAYGSCFLSMYGFINQIMIREYTTSYCNIEEKDNSSGFSPPRLGCYELRLPVVYQVEIQ